MSWAFDNRLGLSDNQMKSASEPFFHALVVPTPSIKCQHRFRSKSGVWTNAPKTRRTAMMLLLMLALLLWLQILPHLASASHYATFSVPRSSRPLPSRHDSEPPVNAQAARQMLLGLPFHSASVRRRLLPSSDLIRPPIRESPVRQGARYCDVMNVDVGQRPARCVCDMRRD